MNIKYQPEALESIINSPWADKRLKNRGGGMAYTPDSPGLNQEGPILEVFKSAQIYAEQHPEETVILQEYSCGSIIA